MVRDLDLRMESKVTRRPQSRRPRQKPTSNAFLSHFSYAATSSGPIKVNSSPAALAERMLERETFCPGERVG